ncbi:hypothetical protein G7Y89_g11514 [Cudoniella acicularis]|uniref:Uncharacterized protein n=1 Tax=Cudoniella acicularis TaxID=354080 RepID=A0A8H4RAP7_9HELO|nr:hypothetical protein G7Y89_g11514 [Cudoniella acicularis]
MNRWPQYLQGQDLASLAPLVNLPPRTQELDISSHNVILQLLSSFDQIIEPTRDSILTEKANVFDHHYLNSFIRWTYKTYKATNTLNKMLAAFQAYHTYCEETGQLRGHEYEEGRRECQLRLDRPVYSSAFIKMAQMLMIQRTIIAAEQGDIEYPADTLDVIRDQFMIYGSGFLINLALKLRVNLAQSELEDLLLIHTDEAREDTVPRLVLRDLKDDSTNNKRVAASGRHLKSGQFKKDYDVVETYAYHRTAHASLVAGNVYTQLLEEAPSHVASAGEQYWIVGREWHTFLGFNAYLGAWRYGLEHLSKRPLNIGALASLEGSHKRAFVEDRQENQGLDATIK